MADVNENESKMTYMKPTGDRGASSMDEGGRERGSSKGFVVREAPWQTGSEKVREVTDLYFIFLSFDKSVHYLFVLVWSHICLYCLSILFPVVIVFSTDLRPPRLLLCVVFLVVLECSHL